jgi:hypothetical protein
MNVEFKREGERDMLRHPGPDVLMDGTVNRYYINFSELHRNLGLFPFIRKYPPGSASGFKTKRKHINPESQTLFFAVFPQFLKVG